MKNYKKHYDIGTREAPVIFFKNSLYIGNALDTHSTLLNKVLGVDFEIKDSKEALDINFSDNITKVSEFEDKILFGNLFENTIYWEAFSSRFLLKKIKKTNKKYKHKLLTYASERN